jgi:hypothetical protein
MTTSRPPDPVRHIVLCRFKSDVAAARRLAFFEQIRRLADLPDIAFSRFQSGLNVSPEGCSLQFTEGYMMDFASGDACFAYLAHPTCRAIRARLIEVLDGGAAGLLVFDIPLQNDENPSRKTGPVRGEHRHARTSRAADAHD